MVLLNIFRKSIVAGLLLINMQLQAEQLASQELIVATELWPTRYTQEDGKGLYQEIVALVFNQHTINYIYTSYDISKTLVQKQQAHFWMGSYPDEEDYAITPTEAFDADRLVAIYMGKYDEGELESLLATENVAWKKNYEYQQYLPEFAGRFYEVPDIKTGLNMLEAQRIKFFLVDFDDITHFLELTALTYSELNLHKIDYKQIKLLPAFNNSPSGKMLAEQWDKNLAKMKKKWFVTGII